VRALLDPYWFLVSDWFAIFLARKGSRLEDTLGMATIVSTGTIGRVVDATQSFTPIFVGASAAPVLAACLLFWMIRREVSYSGK